MKHCVWLKHIIYLGETDCMFGQNSLAALPRGNATALQEKKAQQKKSGEILCHLCLEDPFLLRAVHDDYSFCTRFAPHFYER